MPLPKMHIPLPLLLFQQPLRPVKTRLDRVRVHNPYLLKHHYSCWILLWLVYMKSTSFEVENLVSFWEQVRDQLDQSIVSWWLRLSWIEWVSKHEHILHPGVPVQIAIELDFSLDMHHLDQFLDPKNSRVEYLTGVVPSSVQVDT